MYPLTDCPSQDFEFEKYKDKNILYNTLAWADSKGFPMCCAANSDQEAGNIDEVGMSKQGLVDKHAYTLIGVKEITLDSGKTERLIKVRNPWGKKEWNGAWSDKSPLWTESTKAQVKLTEENDGTFWISMKDFEKFFYLATMCYYRNDYSDSTIIDTTSEGGFGMYKFTLKQSDKDKSKTFPVIFTIDQVNWRFCDSSDDGTDYIAATMYLMITKLDKTKNEDGTQTVTQTFVGGTCTAELCTASKAFKQGLEDGEYVVLY